MVNLLVLDLATLLQDAGRVQSQALRLAAEAVGLRCDEELARELLGLAPFDALARIPSGASAFPEHEGRLVRGVRIFERALAVHYLKLGAVREQDGVSATLRSARAQGIRLALATPLGGDVADLILRGTTWISEGLVDTLVTADDVSYGRPRSDLVVECMRRTGVLELERVGKLGATPADLAEGAVAGCGMNVGATFQCHPRTELRLRPHTHLIDRMAALLDIVSMERVREGTREITRRLATAEKAPSLG